MTSQPLRKEFKVSALPASPEADTIYYVKSPEDTTAAHYVTDSEGNPVPVGAAAGSDAVALIAAHEAAADPHPGYLTPTEGNALYVRTINGTGPDGAGNVVVPGGVGGAVETVNGVVPDGLGNVALDKNDIGLGNVDNTSDAGKPVSTATQSALDGKTQLVLSRTSLKTINPATTAAAYLIEGQRSGAFVFRSGDYSALATLDTQEGVFIVANSVASTSGVWVRDIDGDTLNALYFGTDATGASNTVAAAQCCINVAASMGLKAYFGPGLYQFTSALTWPEGAHITGGGKAAGVYSTKYTYFWANHSGVCLSNDNNTGSRSIRGVNFYRTQTTPGGGWTPTTYGFDVSISGGQDVYIEDCHFHNVSKAIQVAGKSSGTVSCGRIWIENVTGQPLISGIDLTHCTDVVWLDEIHFWPFWSQDANVVSNVRANATAITLARVDNPEFGRIFCWGYQRGMLINNQSASGSLPTGTTNLLTCDSFGADNCSCGVLVNSGADGADLRFGRLYIASDTSAPSISTENFLWLLGNNATINIGNLYGQYTNGSLVGVNGTGNKVVISQSSSLAIDNDGGGSAEFSVDSGNTLTLLSSPVTSSSVKYSGSGIIETPDWRSYTPTVTAQTGSFTTVSATGKYRRTGGKHLEYQVNITITTNGTAAGDVRATLPYTNGASRHFGAAREIASTGSMCTATINPSATVLECVTYNNGYPGGSGYQIIAQGSYEAA